MRDMKAKITALDDLIAHCEDAIARPAKSKRMAAIAVLPEEKDDKESDVFDKKAQLASMLDDLDEDELMRLYEKLEG